MTRLSALLVTGWIAMGTAAADPSRRHPDATALADEDCARARAASRPCILTLENEVVEGGKPSSAGQRIDARDHAAWTSLIRIRSDFRAEIIRGLERL